jgi:hypothetical protein
MVGAEDGLYVIPAFRSKYAPVPKTGATIAYYAGDDGFLEKGVAWPNPRFTDNGNGTVTDNLTGLIWMKNANAFGDRTWAQAMDDARALKSGQKGLTDASKAGAWRLPNVRELQSLISYHRMAPAMPQGHPFQTVANVFYWSSTTREPVNNYAWIVSFGDGKLDIATKISTYPVWCVRGGQ